MNHRDTFAQRHTPAVFGDDRVRDGRQHCRSSARRIQQCRIQVRLPVKQSAVIRLLNERLNFVIGRVVFFFFFFFVQVDAVCGFGRFL